MIYRQGAIDEIDEWIKAFRENGHKESAADACLIQDGIIQLPSAQPEHATLRQIRDGRKAEHMDTEKAAFDAAIKALSCDVDCISRTAVLELFNKYKSEAVVIGIMLSEVRHMPSVQPDYEKIIAEIKQCITETREHGKHHAKFVQDNGELYISGLEMALSIIEENR